MHILTIIFCVTFVVSTYAAVESSLDSETPNSPFNVTEDGYLHDSNESTGGIIQAVKRFWNPPLPKRGLVSNMDPYVVKYFENMDEMLASNYFLNPNRPKNVHAQIQDEPSFYEVYSDPKTANKIVVRETIFGDSKEASLLNQPITKCAYADSQDAEVTLSKSTSFSNLFALLHGVQLTHKYQFDLLSGFLVGANNYLEQQLGFSFTNHTISWNIAVAATKEVSTSHSFGGTINCGSGKGGTVQLFTNIRYQYFPDAKVRYHFYNLHPEALQTAPTIISTTAWGPAYSSLDYLQYGLVLYDNSHGMEYSCVNDPLALYCDTPLPIRVFDPLFDPVKGLHYALTDVL